MSGWGRSRDRRPFPTEGVSAAIGSSVVRPQVDVLGKPTPPPCLPEWPARWQSRPEGSGLPGRGAARPPNTGQPRPPLMPVCDFCRAERPVRFEQLAMWCVFDRGIDQVGPDCVLTCESVRLVRLHEARVADHVERKDRGQRAFQLCLQRKGERPRQHIGCFGGAFASAEPLQRGLLSGRQARAPAWIRACALRPM